MDNTIESKIDNIQNFLDDLENMFSVKYKETKASVLSYELKDVREHIETLTEEVKSLTEKVAELEYKIVNGL